MPFEGSDWAPSNFKHDFIEACCLPSPEGARGAATQKKVYAIPFSAKGNMLFYRKDVLDLFGLSPPETWDALRYAVQTVREGVGASDFAARLEALLLKSFPELKANPTRMAEQMQAWKARLQRLRYGLLLHSRSFHNDFYPIVWGYGGDIFTGDQTKQRLASQALRDIKAMMYEEAASPIRLAPSQAVFEGPFAEASFQLNHAFADGDALFMVDWEDRLDKMLRYVQAERGVHGDTAVRVDSVGVCPIPHMPDQKSACNIGSWGWVVNSQTVSSGDPVRDAIAKKAVEQFLYHLTSEDAQEWLAEHFGYVPSREIRLSEPVLAKLESTNPTVMTLFRFFRTKGKVRFINRPGSKRLNDVLEQALHRALAETPQKDPAAEWEFLSKILAEVRQQAGYL
jgi:multiple sugar transport system substrate-binding protein